MLEAWGEGCLDLWYWPQSLIESVEEGDRCLLFLWECFDFFDFRLLLSEEKEEEEEEV